VHEILYHLPAGALVLDLGCQVGSFDATAFPFRTVRVDLERQGAAGTFVQADAAKLPFKAKIFDALICNHGLEHFGELEAVLREIGRVLRPDSALFVSVPDGSTVHDRIYRWLAAGGGHVNFFDRPEPLAALLASRSGLPHVATKVLYGGFAFVNPNGRDARIRPRMARLLFRWEANLFLATRLFRFLDRHFHTRTAIYGWAMYFGNVPEKVEVQPWTNVCVRCGQGHPSAWLATAGAVRRVWLFFASYRCPGCGAFNLYSRDEDYRIYT
jgi:SAM-dependent methyltransferase